MAAVTLEAEVEAPVRPRS